MASVKTSMHILGIGVILGAKIIIIILPHEI